MQITFKSLQIDGLLLTPKTTSCVFLAQSHDMYRSTMVNRLIVYIASAHAFVTNFTTRGGRWYWTLLTWIPISALGFIGQKDISSFRGQIWSTCHLGQSSADNYRLLNSLATYKGHSKINSTTKTHDIVWSSCAAFKLQLYIGLLYGPYAHDYYVVPLLHLRDTTETQSQHAGRQFSSDLLYSVGQ